MTCYSSDLRQKIVQVYLQGNTSIRAVAKQFVVSTSTVQRYLNQYRQTGELTPQKPGTKRKSVLSEHKADAWAVVADHPDWTLWQYCEYLTEKLGVNVSTSMMDRFCKEHRLTLKKKAIGARRLRQKRFRQSGWNTRQGSRASTQSSWFSSMRQHSGWGWKEN